VVGAISSDNSVRGTAQNGGFRLSFDYNTAKKLLVVGHPNNYFRFSVTLSSVQHMILTGMANLIFPSTAQKMARGTCNNRQTVLQESSSVLRPTKLFPPIMTATVKLTLPFIAQAPGICREAR
jgi:hypothetical protein